MDIRKSSLHLLPILIPFSLCFSLRLSTFFVILYSVSLFFSKDSLKHLVEAIQKKWVIPFLVLFFLHCCSLLWTDNIDAGVFILEKKTSLLAIPILLAMDNNMSQRLIHQIMEIFIWGCCAGLFYSLVYAGYHYLQTGNTEVFFYHQFGMPLNGFNAIYFSFFLLLSVVFLHFLSRKEGELFARRLALKSLILSFLCLGVILLSSKLFILLLVMFFLFNFFTQLKIRSRLTKNKLGWIIGLTALLLGLVLFKPVQHRFNEMVNSQFQVLQLDEFRYDTPFNSLTLRLLFIKFGWEILEENNAFLQGVGVGDAQDKMDAIKVDYNLYHGNPSLNDKGYLGYDFHDQWMELWVQTGVLGPLIWLFILGLALYISRHTGFDNPLFYIVITLFFFSFTESFLERQRGVLPSTFFLCLFIKAIQFDKEKS